MISFAVAAFAAALAVAPADRLAMADRLFNSGKYAEALAEYRAVTGTDAAGADEILYRLAECERALGRREDAIRDYTRLLNDWPASAQADRSRFARALLERGAARRDDLKLLTSDRVATPIRAAAAYYLGEADDDEAAYALCLRLEPRGRYSGYAKFRRAALLTKSAGERDRREAVSLLWELALDKNPELSEEALYLAATVSYSDRRYGEAASLFSRYLKQYPNGAHLASARDCCAWCRYLQGRWADAVAMCGEGKTDALAWLRAAGAYRLGDVAAAKERLEAYLASFPEGAYRAAAEQLQLRIADDEAEKRGDWAGMVACGKALVKASGAASDRLRLAWAEERAGESEAAAQTYLETAASAPGTAEAAEAMYCKAMIDLRAEKWSAAELALKEALAGKLADRLRGKAEYWRGVAACRLDHTAEGAERLREALKRGGLELDEEREARLMLADIAYNAGEREKAIGEYAKLVREGAVARMGAAKARDVGKLLAGRDKLLCAEKLTASPTPEWRQEGYALAGEAEFELGNFAAAGENWRKCLAENAQTPAAAAAAIRYGKLLVERAEYAQAEPVLKAAIERNADDVTARAEAYLALARAAKGRGDAETARGYATVVTTLFEHTEMAKAAAELLDSSGKGK